MLSGARPQSDKEKMLSEQHDTICPGTNLYERLMRAEPIGGIISNDIDITGPHRAGIEVKEKAAGRVAKHP